MLSHSPAATQIYLQNGITWNSSRVCCPAAVGASLEQGSAEAAPPYGW